MTYQTTLEITVYHEGRRSGRHRLSSPSMGPCFFSSSVTSGSSSSERSDVEGAVSEDRGSVSNNISAPLPQSYRARVWRGVSTAICAFKVFLFGCAAWVDGAGGAAAGGTTRGLAVAWPVSLTAA